MAQRTETTAQKTGENLQTARTESTTNAPDYSFAGTKIYIGPSSQKKGLRYSMGFRGGLPPEIKTMCAACADIYELMISPSELTEARKAISKKGSALNQAYLAAEKYLRGGE